MQTEQERKRAEELSREIDKLTIDGPRAVADPEMAGLLEVADMMKHSCSGDEIPHSLIGGMADVLSVELKARQENRRRSRLYTILAGSAAAVVLAVGLQMTLFQTNNELPPVQQLEARVTPTAPAGQASGAAERTTPAPAARQQDKEEMPAAEAQRGPIPQAAAGLLPAAVLDRINEAAGEAKAEGKSGQLAMNKADTATGETPQENMLMAKARVAAPAGRENGGEQGVIRLLVLPGQIAQSITVAPDRRLVEQIYKINGREEIRVIQRLSGTLPADEAASRRTEASAAKEKVNRVMVTRDGYEVTVEGKQTATELKKLADSLVIGRDFKLTE